MKRVPRKPQAVRLPLPLKAVHRAEKTLSPSMGGRVFCWSCRHPFGRKDRREILWPLDAWFLDVLGSFGAVFPGLKGQHRDFVATHKRKYFNIRSEERRVGIVKRYRSM